MKDTHQNRTDVHTPAQRSFNMSRIRGRDTKPEILLRKALWKNGLRYRLKNKLPGKPDIVFVSDRTAVFVDGCFWHRCPEHFVLPKSRQEFWQHKIDRNVERDTEVNKKLLEDGWKVCRVWEHELRSDPQNVVQRVAHLLRKKGTKPPQ